MVTDLKPCPFCGGETHIYVHEEITKLTTKEWYIATCINCLMRSYKYRTYEKAKEAWNRRVNDG